MFFFILRPRYHIINVYLYLVMNRVMEQSYHGSLIGCPNILQSKRHHFVTESSPLCDEGCFLHVFGCHLDLIVTIETVHEGEDLMMYGIFNQNINVGKREVILGACSSQVSVVHTYTDFTVLLRYQNDVSNPLWIGGDSQESGVELFPNFSLDLF